MLLIEHLDTGAEADVFGLADQAGDDLLRRQDRLPQRGDVLAHPGLVVAERVGAADDLEIPVDGLGKRPAGGRRGHEKQAELHAVTLGSDKKCAGMVRLKRPGVNRLRRAAR